jgi:NAD(P)-dependent dehydrogenase (short-subunit alcohol dehydrogenase family)
MKKILNVALALLVLVSPTLLAQTEENPKAAQKAVLVTGASGKLGMTMTQHLSSKGYLVYAGARTDEDMAVLNQMDNVRALKLDVTEPEQITAAVNTVKAGGVGLHGLVNNAGILRTGNLTEISEDDFDAVLQVNVYGPYRVTKAFAPLLKEQHGRIVNISSTGGTSCLPTWGVYCMSKAALEMYTDTLAMEFSTDGVKVIAIEPGNYGPKEMGGGDPMDIAKAIEQAIFIDAKPKPRYLVVPIQKNATTAIASQMHRMLQMNHDQPYSLDLGTLEKMLSKQYKNMLENQNKSVPK